LRRLGPDDHLHLARQVGQVGDGVPGREELIPVSVERQLDGRVGLTAGAGPFAAARTHRRTRARSLAAFGTRRGTGTWRLPTAGAERWALARMLPAPRTYFHFRLWDRLRQKQEAGLQVDLVFRHRRLEADLADGDLELAVGPQARFRPGQVAEVALLHAADDCLADHAAGHQPREAEERVEAVHHVAGGDPQLRRCPFAQAEQI